MLKVVLVSVLAACAHAPHGERPFERFAPVLTEAEIGARCHAGPGNALSVDVDVSDAPILVLEEAHLHGSGPPSPRIAIWSDGSVLFERGPHWQAATLPLARVRQLQREILTSIAREPRDTSLHDASGGQVTWIIARDGATWHVAEVYGAWQDDFFDAAAGRVEPPHPEVSPATATTPAIVFQSPDEPRPPPSRSFATAYRTLLNARPPRGLPFEPYDYDLVLFGTPASDPSFDRSHVYPWPQGLPRPPASLLPAACDVNETPDGCHFILDRRYAVLARQFQGTDPRTNWPSLIAEGRDFKTRLDGTYRGARTIEAVEECSRKLVTSHGATSAR